MTNCAWCGRTAAPADAFCTGCGQPLYEVAPALCEACGRALPPDAAYCGRCGAPRCRRDSAPFQPSLPPRTPPPYWRVAALGFSVAAASLLAQWLFPVASFLGHSFSISQAAQLCTVSTSRPGLAAAAHLACRASDTGQVFVHGGLGLGGLLLLAALLAAALSAARPDSGHNRKRGALQKRADRETVQGASASKRSR